MTDKELLELAAKAAGLKSCGYNRMGGLSIAYDDGSGELGVYTNWTPLTDDGDALRLAVKLNVSIVLDSEISVVHVGRFDFKEDIREEEVQKIPPYAATRRAIVRAAAEIGKGMK